FRDVDQYWTGAAARGEKERFAKDVRQLVGVRDEIVVLRDRHRDAGDVDFLKRILAEQRARNLSGNRNERRGVHPRVGEGRDEIRGAGAAGRDAHADAAGRARVAFGGVARALLVSAQYVTQPLAVAGERVIG